MYLLNPPSGGAGWTRARNHQMELNSPEALVLPAGVHHLCSCGHSRHYPLCDGRHAKKMGRGWRRWWF